MAKMMGKKREQYTISTPLAKEDVERIKEIAKAQGMTVAVFLKHAVTAYCHSLNYLDVNLLKDIDPWGGAREGGGRPSTKEKNDV
jgi:hypothetical protein